MSIRIIIADDHQLIREGLKVLLEKESDMEVVGEASDGIGSISLTRELAPDVVVMDVRMPEMSGIAASHQILSEFPRVKIIALSTYSDRRYVLDMLKTGAHGYLLKDCAFEELARAIRLVTSDRNYLCPEIAKIVVKGLITSESGAGDSVVSVLSPREREVLQLIAEGKRSSEIADLLHISVKTVDTHRQQIMHKLQTRSVAQLTKYAIREGLIPWDN
jgi:DNA-binding NarL/FixJ family response regulator